MKYIDTTILAQLKKLLAELNKYPGILGSAIITKDGEVIVKEMPDYIRDSFINYLSTIEGFTEKMLEECRDIAPNEIIVRGKYDQVIGINLGEVTLIVISSLKANLDDILNVIYETSEDIKKYTNILLEKPLEFPIEAILSSEKKKLNREVSVAIFRILRYINLRKYLGISNDVLMYYFGKELSNILKFKNLEELGDFWKKYKLGEVEQISNDPIKIRIYDCISCSGFPNVGKPLCHFEGGVLEGFMEHKFNKKFTYIETKCCGLGNEYCEFELNPVKNKNKQSNIKK